jgi:predicted oxidoreductase (fatty acid repression mutant protein)
MRPASPKKSSAQKIFGSNLFLKNQKIVSVAQTQWAALCAARAKISEKTSSIVMVELFDLVHTYFIKNC